MSKKACMFSACCGKATSRVEFAASARTALTRRFGPERAVAVQVTARTGGQRAVVVSSERIGRERVSDRRRQLPLSGSALFFPSVARASLGPDGRHFFFKQKTAYEITR